MKIEEFKEKCVIQWIGSEGEQYAMPCSREKEYQIVYDKLINNFSIDKVFEAKWDEIELEMEGMPGLRIKVIRKEEK